MENILYSRFADILRQLLFHYYGAVFVLLSEYLSSRIAKAACLP